MRIVFVFDERSLRRWRLFLVERITSAFPDAAIGVVFQAGEETVPTSVELLLALERMTLWRGRETLCDRLPDETLDSRRADENFTAELTVDCTRSGLVRHPRQGKILQPLYDGAAGDGAIYAALISGRSPMINIVDQRAGATIVSGTASLEAAEGLTGGVEAVTSRVALLLESAIRNPVPCVSADIWAPLAQPKAPIVRYATGNLARECARRLYHLCCYAPHWRIGWRRVTGEGLFERGNLEGDEFKVIEDPGSRCFADPFPFTWQGRTFLFFEDLDHRQGRGVISVLEFNAFGPIGEPRVVLDEKWHLSYPFVMEHDGELYMTPECSGSGAILLYRCIEFPHRWEQAAHLIDNIEAADPTIFRRDGRFWLTSCVRNRFGGYSDALAIHYADHLFGPWRPHARFPVLVDPGSARPAGAVFTSGGALWRPVQDCSSGYGRALKIMRVDTLTPDQFKQTERVHIRPGSQWPGGRLHTFNRSGDLEFIDGTSYTLKSARMRKWCARISAWPKHSEFVSQSATA